MDLRASRSERFRGLGRFNTARESEKSTICLCFSAEQATQTERAPVALGFEVFSQNYWLVVSFSPISSMISCRLSTLATLSMPNRWRFADNEPTSGRL